MKVATKKQITEIDLRAIGEYGIDPLALMEAAGRAVFEAAGDLAAGRAAVFSKSGKNGGDGFVAARHFMRSGADTRVFYLRGAGEEARDTAAMREQYEAMGGKVIYVTDINEEINGFCERADVIVDCIFGTGLTREVTGLERDVIERINLLGAFVVSADIPSGILCDTGEVLGIAVRASRTVTFTAAKPVHILPDARAFCGRVTVCDIGIPDALLKEYDLTLEAADERLLDRICPPRVPDTHKGSYGKALIVAGSTGYAGAAALSASAAVRAGAGLVFLGVPLSIYPIAAGKLNEPVVFPLADDGDGRLAEESFGAFAERLARCDVCLVGPGLSVCEGTRSIVRRILKHASCPVVLDADGINCLGGNIDLLRERGAGVTVLTPHDGEFDRLTGVKPGKDGRIDLARAFSQKTGCVLLLKGHRTVVAAPDGRAFINTSGNPGMAKGGSGDVLSGVVTALIAQGAEPFYAAAGGAYLHGRAGDLCANEIGEYGMTPSDMLKKLPAVLKKYNSREW